jgi:nucleoside-diphosphate-sugar epimerase
VVLTRYRRLFPGETILVIGASGTVGTALLERLLTGSVQGKPIALLMSVLSAPIVRRAGGGDLLARQAAPSHIR